MNRNNSGNGESKSSGVNGVNNYAVCVCLHFEIYIYIDFRIGVCLFGALCVICINKICYLHVIISNWYVCKTDCYDTIGTLSERDVLPYLCMTWNN